MAIKLGDAFVSFTADMTDLNKKVNQSVRAMKKDFGGLMDVSKQLGVAFTAIGGAIVGGLGLGVKAASDYESAFTGVVKTVDATAEELEVLNKGFRTMATEVPITAVELAKIGEAAGQLGIKKESILSFTKTIADLGVSSNLSGEEGASMLAKFANITQMDQSKFSNLGSAIVALGNNGASTEADIASMALRLAGAGAAAKMSEGDILGIANSLSSLGIEAEAGGSAFSKVIVDMAEATALGGAKLEGFASVAGMTADEFATKFRDDAGGALASFVAGLGNVEAEGGNLFVTLKELGIEEVRMRDALMRASGAGTMFADSMRLGNSAFVENTALTIEAEKRYATFESQVKLLWNSITDLGITIGEALMPTLKSLMETIKPVVLWIGEWVKAHPELTKWIVLTVGFIGGLMLALGPLLMVLPGIAVAFTGISTALPGIAAGLGVATTAMTGFAVPALAVLGPAGIIAAGVIVIGTAIAAWWNLAAAQDGANKAHQEGDANMQRFIETLKSQGVAIDELAMKTMSVAEQEQYLNKLSQQNDKDKFASKMEYFQNVSRLTDEEIWALHTLSGEQQASLLKYAESLKKTGMTADEVSTDVRAYLARLSLDHRESPSINDMAMQGFDTYTSMLSGLGNTINSILEGIRASFFYAWENITQTVIGAINAILNAASQLTGIQMPNIGGGGVGVPPFADGGTMRRSGVALVGERGPELVNLPAGARVFSNKESRGMMGGDSGSISIVINNPVVRNDGDLRAINVGLQGALEIALSKRGLRPRPV